MGASSPVVFAFGVRVDHRALRVRSVCGQVLAQQASNVPVAGVSVGEADRAAGGGAERFGDLLGCDQPGRVRVLFGVEEFGQAGGDLVEGRGGVGQGREGERVRSADRSGGLDVREAGEAFAGCRVDAVGRVEYEDVSSGLPVCACLVEDG